MTVANAEVEAGKENRELAIPSGRTLKADGVLNEKYRCGIEAHKKCWRMKDLTYG